MKVGEKIYFEEEKRPYTIQARNERYMICTKPFAARKTVIYTIVDFEKEERGPDNLIFGLPYETKEQIIEISRRRSIPLRINNK